MIVSCRVQSPPVLSSIWEERWEGPDRGIVASWLRGIEKAAESPALAGAALGGELPVLPWKGGVAKKIKAKGKIGSHLYLAMWTGLRGQDLDLDTEEEVEMTCTRTSVTVTFTHDVDKLKQALPEDQDE